MAQWQKAGFTYTPLHSLALGKDQVVADWEDFAWDLKTCNQSEQMLLAETHKEYDPVDDKLCVHVLGLSIFKLGRMKEASLYGIICMATK